MEKVLSGSGFGIEGRTQGGMCNHQVEFLLLGDSTKICVLSFLGSLASNSLTSQGTSYRDSAAASSDPSHLAPCVLCSTSWSCRTWACRPPQSHELTSKNQSIKASLRYPDPFHGQSNPLYKMAWCLCITWFLCMYLITSRQLRTPNKCDYPGNACPAVWLRE